MPQASCIWSDSLLQVSPEVLYSRERLTVLGPVGCPLAGDDVVNGADWESSDISPTTPCVREPLDTVRGEHEIHVGRSVLELYKVLSALDVLGLVVAGPEPKSQRAAVSALPLVLAFYTKRSASCVVSGNDAGSRLSFR